MVVPVPLFQNGLMGSRNGDSKAWDPGHSRPQSRSGLLPHHVPRHAQAGQVSMLRLWAPLVVVPLATCEAARLHSRPCAGDAGSGLVAS